jgi:hypothetical protein
MKIESIQINGCLQIQRNFNNFLQFAMEKEKKNILETVLKIEKFKMHIKWVHTEIKV